jgi:5-methylcytosine-specific restriction endonuclease McrA
MKNLGFEWNITPIEIWQTRIWRCEHKFDPCYYCGEYKEGEMSDDHIIPIIDGGTDHWYNLERACHPCNQAKGEKSLVEFIIGGCDVSV